VMEKDRLNLSEITLILLIALAFALRVYRLDHQSLWYDEGISLHCASRGLKNLILGRYVENHPPLYFIFLHLWMALAGQSEFSIRFPSLIWGVLTVPLTFKLGQRLLDRKAGLLAAFLLSISPFHVWFSQEARMYALATLLGASSVYFFIAMMGKARRSEKTYCSYILCSILGLYTHFYVALIVAFENAAFLAWWARDQLMKLKNGLPSPLTWLLIQLCIIALFLPYIPFAAARYTADATYWEGTLKWTTIVKNTLAAFSAGRAVEKRTAKLAALGFSALAALGVLVLLSDRSRAWTAILLILYLAVPTLVLFAISHHRPKFAPRYLLPILPAFYLLIAAGLSPATGGRQAGICRWLAIAGLILPLGFVSGISAHSLANYYFDDRYARPDFRAVAEYIRSHSQPGDAIILVGGHMQAAFGYYYNNRDLPVYPLPEGLILSTKEPLDYRDADELNLIAQGRNRLWLVLWQNRIVDPTSVVLDQLMMNCRRLQVGRRFQGLGLLLFSLEGRPRFGGPPQHLYEANFADRIELLGYDLDVHSVEPGQTIHLALYWKALREMEKNYTVFTHLLGEDGRIYGQHDKIAASETYPTSHWRTGTIVRDKFKLTVLSEAPPGKYVIEVGLYSDPLGLQRLPLKSGGDRVLLAEIEVGKK